MMNVVVRQLFPVIASIQLTGHSSFLLIKQKTDGSRSPLPWRTNKRTEKEIRQRIEPLMHSNHIGRNNSGIGSIDRDSFPAKTFLKFHCKQQQGYARHLPFFPARRNPENRDGQSRTCRKPYLQYALHASLPEGVSG